MKNSNLTILATAALAAVVLSTNPARAGIEITPDHIVGTPTYPVTGTLMAVDAPTSDYTNNTPISGPQGPDWPQASDDGWSIPTGNTVYTEWSGKGGWEPDGTTANAPHIAWFNNKPGKSVTWTFALPDGATVNNAYAVWAYQGNSGSGHTYTCNEGTLNTFTRSAAASTGNLVLKWTNSASAVSNANFQRIFAGPIVVAGGDGFKVTFTQVQSGAYPYIDAVVIDYTIPTADPPVIAALSPADDVPSVGFSDKIQHALAFAGLSLAYGLMFPRRRLRVLAGVVALGIAIEVLQGIMPFGRDAELADLAADAVGIAAGFIVLRLLAGPARLPT